VSRLTMWKVGTVVFALTTVTAIAWPHGGGGKGRAGRGKSHPTASGRAKRDANDVRRPIRIPADKLGQIRCPAMIVHAQHDLIPEEFSKSLAAGIPGAEYVLLEGLGHFAYLEDTRRATTPVIDFLQKVAR